LLAQKWQHKDTPKETTVVDFIKSQTDWEEAKRAVGEKFMPTLSANLKVDSQALLKEVYELYREVGAVQWQSQSTLNLFGLSLNHNPNHPANLWKMGSFGHPRYKNLSAYDYYKAVDADKANRVKDDYLDSYGFRSLLPAVETKPHLKALFESFKLPVVRSTARTINGALCYPTPQGDGGMHVDDSPFEVLRINISLSNNGDFGLQYLGNNPIFTKAGDNLIVNTDVKHRAFIKQHNDFIRTNLIIGVAPWMNYDKEKDEWSLNEYFGRLHPYDIVNQELLLNGNFQDSRKA
jgi:hypothetical protein